jgi:hypothetical protein
MNGWGGAGGGMEPLQRGGPVRVLPVPRAENVRPRLGADLRERGARVPVIVVTMPCVFVLDARLVGMSVRMVVMRAGGRGRRHMRAHRGV